MKKISYCFILFTVLISVSSCDNAKNKLVVGVHSWPGIGPVYVGDEKGFFKDEGIDLNIKVIENFDTKRSSLISGQIDVDMGNTLDQLLIYRENKFDAAVFVVEDFSVGGDGIVSKTGINSLNDLKGKTITYAEASPSDFFLRYLMKQNGIPMDSLRLKPVADAQVAGNAILAEQVDAAVTFDPWLTQAKANKNLKVLVSTKQYPTLIPGLLIASQRRINDNKELFEKFVRAWFKSVDYYYSHAQESSAIIAKRMNIKAEELAGVLSSIHILTHAENMSAFDGSKTGNMNDLLKNINLFWKESGFVKNIFDPSSMQESSLLK